MKYEKKYASHIVPGDKVVIRYRGSSLVPVTDTSKVARGDVVEVEDAYCSSSSPFDVAMKFVDHEEGQFFDDHQVFVVCVEEV